ncbi:hypothetical protein HYV31_00810 [candidate division WWE3 bacterium]|nr:hypothetical protein [candidate division WWE3 bacterium]
MGNYSGNKILVDACPKITLKGVFDVAKDQLLTELMKRTANVAGFDVEFSSSSLAHGGKRLWFKCPICSSRAGVLYKHFLTQQVGCRTCLNLDYKSRRYKGMTENSV